MALRKVRLNIETSWSANGYHDDVDIEFDDEDLEDPDFDIDGYVEETLVDVVNNLVSWGWGFAE